MSPCCQFGGTIICTDIDWPRPKGGGKRMAGGTKAHETGEKVLLRADVIKRLNKWLERCIEDLEDLAWVEGYTEGKARMSEMSTLKKPKGKIGKAVKKK